jgi:tetratricopeptide (TPR) repeat protein
MDKVQYRIRLRHSKSFVSTLVLGAALSLVAFLTGACTVSSDKIEYSRGEEAAAKSDYEGALKHYKTIVDHSVKTPLAIQAAKEAARLTHYQLKRYKEAAELYKYVILYSPIESDRIEAQRKLADLLFNETLDYSQAITEYNRLIELPHTTAEDLAYRLAIAKSYFYLSNFFQSQVEIDTILKRGTDKALLFEALQLKASIFLTTKKLDDAITTLKEIMDKYPERAKNETIGLTLAVTYEEQKNFAKAIETLESIKDSYPRKDFINQRIKILRERQSYLPGARGLKK